MATLLVKKNYKSYSKGKYLRNLFLILAGALFFYLIHFTSAWEISTASYSIDSTHSGLTGSEAETTNYDSRDTLTYEQGGSSDGETASYEFNSGWFRLTTNGETDGNATINSIECSNDTVNYYSCSEMNYNSNITHIRVNCTSPTTITNVTYTLYNSPDDTNYIDNLSYTYNDGDFYILNSSYKIQDSGDWNLTITCIAQNSDVQSSFWEVAWGYLQINLIEPITDMSVALYEYFTFSSNVTCIGGECGEVNVTLDPSQCQNITTCQNITQIECQNITQEICENCSSSCITLCSNKTVPSCENQTVQSCENVCTTQCTPQEICEESCTMDNVCEEICKEVESCEEQCVTDETGEELCETVCTMKEACSNECSNQEVCQEICEESDVCEETCTENCTDVIQETCIDEITEVCEETCTDKNCTCLDAVEEQCNNTTIQNCTSEVVCTQPTNKTSKDNQNQSQDELNQTFDSGFQRSPIANYTNDSGGFNGNQSKGKKMYKAGERIEYKNKTLGEKLEDEPEYEAYFKSIEQNNETIEIIFYHDYNGTLPVRVEGNITYNLSEENPDYLEEVGLSVNLISGIIPKFELHVGATSEVFQFGKTIPVVDIVNGSYEIEDRNDTKLNLDINTSTTRIKIKGVEDQAHITARISQVNDSNITTQVVAVRSIPIEEAEITLEKNSNVTTILRCDEADFNYTTLTCTNWQEAGVEFIERNESIVFNVTHFTAYAGGNLSSNETAYLTIWDENDPGMPNASQTRTINEDIRFFADYKQSTNGSKITSGNCSIYFSDNITANMTYNTTYTYYLYNRTFPNATTYTYEINCTHGDFTNLSASDTVSVQPASTKSGAVSTVIGATPFYTTNQNPLSCSIPRAGDSCETSWLVNATGILGTTHEFWVIYNMTTNRGHVSDNESEHVFITISSNDSSQPIILSTTIDPDPVTLGENTSLYMTTSDDIQIDTCWANITLPDLTVTTLNNVCDVAQNYETTALGIHNVTFFVNDTNGTLSTKEDYFTVQAGNSLPTILLNTPQNDSTGISTSPALNVTLFDTDLDTMNVTFFDASTDNQIGSIQQSVTNGSSATVIWGGLDSDTTYEWYVNVTDGSTTVQSITWNFTTIGDLETDPWTTLHPPEGVFSPDDGGSYSGTHRDEMSILFGNLTLTPAQTLSCDIKMSNGSIRKVQETGITLSGEEYTLNYTVQETDSIIFLDGAGGYIPWVLKNCSVFESGSALFTQNTTDLANNNKSAIIYVHSPGYWLDSEVTAAVSCANNPGKYFNNTESCSFSGDTMFALQMRNGNPVEEGCYNNFNESCGESLCTGLPFQSCTPLEYHTGYSADIIDPNGLAEYTETVSGGSGSFSPEIKYTRYVNSSGNFKLRIRESTALSNMAWTFTLVNLTNVQAANVYGPTPGNGELQINPGVESGHYNINYENLSSGAYSGTFDFTLNISFDSSTLNEDNIFYLTIAYGQSSNQGSETRATVTFNTTDGYRNDNESEGNFSAFTVDDNGRCGDGANNDFDYISGTWANSYDCYDSDCVGFLGQTQNNAPEGFSSSITGLCNFATESICDDEYNNDYDSYTDCHDSDCFQTDASCPIEESICDDGLNNDWDYTNGETDASASQKIENNGTKWDGSHQSALIDCEDVDCDGEVGGSSGQLCNWGYETSCSDGFDNDALQLADCQLVSLGSSTTHATPAYAEYDCADSCRSTSGNTTETGAQCSDGIDNDWDALTIEGYYTDQYSANQSGGVDCRWGGYFGYGTNYNPDEDCNATILDSGYECQLQTELNCTDGFDNDFDSDASGMPNAGWSANTTAYLDFFGVAYSGDADYDDYDCAYTPGAITDESVNASFCFDGIDNDLDAYFWNDTEWTLNSSTGIDCSDPNCLGVVNPANENITCLSQEYNATDSFFTDLDWPGMFCANSLDDDADSDTDCADSDCFQQFSFCSLGPCYDEENITWNSCADADNNDDADGTDCADSDCIGMIGDSSTGATCGATENSCTDGFDNDASGGTDCADSDCNGEVGGAIKGIEVYCSASESTATDCTDGFDNDADGSIDCYDDGCLAHCTGFSTVSGTSLISLPQYSGVIGISAGTARVEQSTDEVRRGESYTIRFVETSSSGDVQWTLGTSSDQFEKSNFNTGTASLSGPDAASFSLTETPNGWTIDETATHPTGYDITFSITTTTIMSASTYELTFADSEGSRTSTNNFINYRIHEDTPPVANALNVSPQQGIDYAGALQIRANASDNNAFGRCEFSITGAGTHSANSNNCKINYSPTVEGVYTISATPVDRYSNSGTPIATDYDLNIRPTGKSTTTDKRFYNSSDELTINATFNLPATDSLGNCQVIAKNTTEVFTLSNFDADGAECYNASIPLNSLSDGIYIIYINVTETTESESVEGLTKPIFICDNNTNGMCRFADFDGDSNPDMCGLESQDNSTPPQLTIGKNATTLIYEEGSININWTATDDSLDRVIFNITYPNGSLLFYSNLSAGELNLTPLNLTEIGAYTISLWANDTEGTSSSTQDAFTIYQSTELFVHIKNPQNNTEYGLDTQHTFIANLTSSGGNSTNCSVTLYLENTSVINFTLNENSTKNISLVPEGQETLVNWSVNTSGLGTTDLNVTALCDSGINGSAHISNISVTEGETPLPLANVFTFPEGYYYIEPTTPPLAGNFKYNFTITMHNQSGSENDIFGCYINQSNCYDAGYPTCTQIFPNISLSSDISNSDVQITYLMNSSGNDLIGSLGGGSTDNWIPWRIISCGHYNSDLTPIEVNNSINWRIHVHPIDWTIGDIANSVNARTQPNEFAQNTIKADPDGDTGHAVAKYGGTNVELFCHDSIDNPEEPDVLIDGNDSECRGITYSNYPKQDFDNSSLYYAPSGSHGTLAPDIPAGDIGINQTSFSGSFGETDVQYTMHSLPDGTFKIRFRHWSVSKTVTIYAEGFPEINSLNKYFPQSGANNGELVALQRNDGVWLDQDSLDETETWPNKIGLKSFVSGGDEVNNLDTVVNMTFNPSEVNMSEGYIIRLTFNYVEGVTEYIDYQNITIYFDNTTYNGGVGNRWNSTNENEWDIQINGTDWGPCNDTINGDFDFLNCLSVGNQNCFEQASYDCYDLDCNQKPGTRAWNDYLSSWTHGTCGYYNESQTDSMCFDNYNNDWQLEDPTWGHANSGLNLIDCRDSDCDNITNPDNLTETCEHDIELNCSDGFDNDMWQQTDCEGAKTGSYDSAEYDCSDFCRSSSGNTTETGVQCSDGIDNDWDLWYTTTGGSAGYSKNTTLGGMDCHWTDSFGYGGASEKADYDCNDTTLSSGFECQLEREINCSDGFDNDFDSEATGMPSAGWSQSAYEAHYSTTFTSDADFDDYDCSLTSGAVTDESINSSWCFDGIDNDLDAYFWNGAGYSSNSSTGIDCDDPDCIGVVNPENPSVSCAAYEYNASDSFYDNSSLCEDTIDNDNDGSVDCSDSDCAGQFDKCGPCSSTEMIAWDACADGINNDYLGGTDAADSDCDNQLTTYDHQFHTPTEDTLIECTDGYDNDQSEGMDCSDANCDGIGICGSEICNDDLDNDGDGLIDCQDIPDCNAETYCNTTTDMGGSYTPPTNTTATYGAITSTYSSRVRVGTPFTFKMSAGAYSTSANIYLGSLTGDGLPVGQGLDGEGFTTNGPTATNFETQSYSENGDNTKGQIVLQDPSDGAPSIDTTISIPTSETLDTESFEFYHYIDGTASTENIISFRILEDTAPVVEAVVTEGLDVEYDGSIWVGVRATDAENGEYNDGTISTCFWNMSGPNGYFRSGSDSSDCRFTIGNLIDDGSYTLNVWARDDNGNIGGVNTTTQSVNILPKAGAFSLANHEYNSTDTLFLTATFQTDDASSIQDCNVYFQNLSEHSVLAGTISASNTDDTLTCSGSITAPAGDSLYGIWVEAIDSESDSQNVSKESFYVCDNLTSSGTGTNGELWDCSLVDLNDDGILDSCSFNTTPETNSTLNITSTNITPHVTKPNNTVFASMNASSPNLDTCWINITYPDLTDVLFNNSCSQIHNISAQQLGRYNVTFNANDTDGNMQTLNDYFEVLNPFNFTLTTISSNDTLETEMSMIYPRTQEVIHLNDTNGSYTAEVPFSIYDLLFKAFTDKLQVTLRNVNISIDNNKSFGMDRLDTPPTGYLVTYGVNSNYTFDNATVRVYYDDLSFTTESNLRLNKCDSWNFTGQSCDARWYDVTVNATQNQTDDYFEYGTLNFSGFSIREIISPPEDDSNSGGGVGGGGGRINCIAKWNCTNWSDCTPEGIQRRNCTNIGNCLDSIDKPNETRACNYVSPDEPYLNPNETPAEGNRDTKERCDLLGLNMGRFIFCWYWWILVFFTMLVVALSSRYLLKKMEMRHKKERLLKGMKEKGRIGPSKIKEPSSKKQTKQKTKKQIIKNNKKSKKLK